MNERQGAKLWRVFELLPSSVAAATEIINPEPPARAGLELDDPGLVVESTPSPETPLFWPMKWKDEVLSQNNLNMR